MKVSNGRGRGFQDPLYGSIAFDEPMSRLVKTPTVQRLRHVRLSNIDSVDMPSIANLSRMEHVLGVGYLAGSVGFLNSMPALDALAFKAAALLHDWAITAYGHLVEEALQYVDTKFDHEKRLGVILTGDDTPEIGGLRMQILCGRGIGLREWAQRSVGEERADVLLRGVRDNILGKGRWGRAVAGDIDLDNLDNVYRMAFHLGLPVDGSIPLRIAKAMVGVGGRGDVVFKVEAEPLIEDWRSSRRAVYDRLMLAEGDFVGKLMMLYATVEAYEAGEFSLEEWHLVDHEFLGRLANSETPSVRDTAQRWVCGEPWDCTPLRWMEGSRPAYPDLLRFSRDATALVGRHCFAYAIKDKRDRLLSIGYDDGSRRTYGTEPRQWLLGIGSSKRGAFDPKDVERLFGLAEDLFGTIRIGMAHAVKRGRPSDAATAAAQACLF